ncbi:protein kinase [Candidatus Uabimicrobium sp. HlEnr_7]|uniref:protein kinase domain-containing protein n=1 Tax=Candidatus Uabimicrobium helgolandensis TaxID=3095367 RepID=UPI003557CFD0
MFLPRMSLKSQKKSLVFLIKAPDGIPWAMAVFRGTSPQEYLKPVAAALGYETTSEKWGSKFNAVTNSLQEIIDNRQFFSLKHEENTCREFYISSSDMKYLFGQTILRKIINTFNNCNTIVSSDRLESEFDDSRSYDVDELTSIEKKKQINEKLHASSPKLAIQTDGEELGIVRLRQDRSVLWDRYFICEDLTHLKTVRYSAYKADNVIAEDVLNKKYLQLRKLDRNFEWKCKIEISELIGLLANLAFSLNILHDKGVVHSDLKPDNILITENGMVAIDSMDTAVGKNSKGITIKYAAPEQIMRETVSVQTDQYAFGVILSELFGGVIYGEEVNFVIPTGGKNSARTTMLKNPGVFLDPTTCALPTKSISVVRSLISKCLSFKPENRFFSMNEIGKEMHRWLKDYEFSFRLDCPLDFGVLKQDNKEKDYWLLTDSYR